MRTLTATLQAALDSTKVIPYLKLVFNHGSDSYDFSTDSSVYGNRILMIDHSLEPYNGYANIILQNNQRDVPDMTGYWVEIGYGAVTAIGNEYIGDGTNEPGMPRLWVKHQQTVSVAGKLYSLLELEDMWAVLRETYLLLGVAPFYQSSFEEETVYTIIGDVLAEAGFTLQSLGTQDDSIINTYTPLFDVNAVPYETAAQVIYRLIQMTKCYLRPKDDLEFEVRYPADTDTVERTYQLDSYPKFYEYTERWNVLVPNHIYVVYGEQTDGSWLGVVDVEDAAEIAKYMDVPSVYQAGAITESADAVNRATVILTRLIAESTLGTMLAPLDPALELYDKISVIDIRA
ncbi:MAG: hypothetical protein M0R06_00425 [Sphaerochaeta sp.]|jgi:hypothetical protein|nr:hypothetical protein [Sphaerochaeta sp.]